MKKELKRIATLGGVLLVSLFVFSHFRHIWRKNEDLTVSKKFKKVKGKSPRG